MNTSSVLDGLDEEQGFFAANGVKFGEYEDDGFDIDSEEESVPDSDNNSVRHSVPAFITETKSSKSIPVIKSQSKAKKKGIAFAEDVHDPVEKLQPLIENTIINPDTGFPCEIPAIYVITLVANSIVIPVKHGPAMFRRTFSPDLASTVTPLFWCAFASIYQDAVMPPRAPAAANGASREDCVVIYGERACYEFATFLDRNAARMGRYKLFFLRYAVFALAETVFHLFPRTFATQPKRRTVFNIEMHHSVYRIVSDLLHGIQMNDSLLTQMQKDLFPPVVPGANLSPSSSPMNTARSSMRNTLNASRPGSPRNFGSRFSLPTADSRKNSDASETGLRRMASRSFAEMRRTESRSSGSGNGRRGLKFWASLNTVDFEDETPTFESLGFDYDGFVKQMKATYELAASLGNKHDRRSLKSDDETSMMHEASQAERDAVIDSAEALHLNWRKQANITNANLTVSSDDLHVPPHKLALVRTSVPREKTHLVHLDARQLSPAVAANLTSAAGTPFARRSALLPRTVPDPDEKLLAQQRVFKRMTGSITQAHREEDSRYEHSRAEALEEIEAVEAWYDAEVFREDGVIDTFLKEPDPARRELLIANFVHQVILTNTTPVHALLNGAIAEVSEAMRMWKEKKAEELKNGKASVIHEGTAIRVQKFLSYLEDQRRRADEDDDLNQRIVDTTSLLSDALVEEITRVQAGHKNLGERDLLVQVDEIVPLSFASPVITALPPTRAPIKPVASPNAKIQLINGATKVTLRKGDPLLASTPFRTTEPLSPIARSPSRADASVHEGAHREGGSLNLQLTPGRDADDPSASTPGRGPDEEGGSSTPGVELHPRDHARMVRKAHMERNNSLRALERSGSLRGMDRNASQGSASGGMAARGGNLNKIVGRMIERRAGEGGAQGGGL